MILEFIRIEDESLCVYKGSLITVQCPTLDLPGGMPSFSCTSVFRKRVGASRSTLKVRVFPVIVESFTILWFQSCTILPFEMLYDEKILVSSRSWP